MLVVCTGILVGIVCVILFLLPIVVFCMMAAPFCYWHNIYVGN